MSGGALVLSLEGFLHLPARKPNFCLSALAFTVSRPVRRLKENVVISKWCDALGLSKSLGQPELCEGAEAVQMEIREPAGW